MVKGGPQSHLSKFILEPFLLAFVRLGTDLASIYAMALTEEWGRLEELEEPDGA